MSSIHNLFQKQAFLWLLFFLLLVGMEVNAANEIILNNSGRTKINVTENTLSHLLISNTISSFNTLFVKTDKGEFIELQLDSYSKTNTIGSPQLPVLSKLIEIPEGSTPEVKVISFDLKEYLLADFGITQKLFPTQAPQSKNSVKNVDIAFNRQVYETNSFYGDVLVQVKVTGNLRGVQLANLVLSPVQYNPVTNTIRVYNNLVVEINFSGANQLKSVENNSKLQSPYFKSIIGNVLNGKPTDVKAAEVSDSPVKYVIVSDPMFRDALQPFIKWKVRRGFNVIEAYTSDPAVGATSASIKAHLQSIYTSATPTDPAPSFVLFVGDVAQIPAFNCGDHVSDLYYCEYTGDYLPEVFYGRFSANTVDELLPQINKTLQYEQYLMPDPSFLNQVLMAAGADASHQLKWGNGQVNYATTYYFNEAHNLVPHIYLQPEPAGSNYSNSIQANISNGVSFANYSAHGSAEGWTNPSFTISDVDKLQNTGKYGLMVGNSCQTNAFDQNSFGEALLRAEDKGALGYIGASGLTFWDEDYWWSVGNGSVVSDAMYETTGPGAYDRIFHDHGQPRSEWYSTMGQMVFAGNLAVQESNSEMKKQYWESYCLMGDPSTMIYFGVPSALKAEYTSLLPLGATTFQIKTEAFASVAISGNSILHGVAEADENGLATVQLQPFTQTGYADIVITMQNRKPYIDSVSVESPHGPYIAIQNVVVKDQDGNTNNMPEPGESLTLDILLNNLGNSDAVNAISTLSTTDTYFTIPVDTHTWPSIAANGSALAKNIFNLQVSENIPDMHKANFTITTQADSGTFTSDFNFVVYAPKLINGTIRFDDSISGNGNGQIDAGETIVVTAATTNSGHSISGDVSIQLFLFGDNLATNSSPLNIGKLASDETGTSVFTFTVSPDAILGSRISIYTAAIAGQYNSISRFNLLIGQQVEDFETGNFLKNNWKFKGNKPWEISSPVKSEGSYGAKSGTINNLERSEMYMDGQVLFNDTISFYRKVSSENGYDFLKFYIDSHESGSWSGAKGWEKVSYPVLAGKHRFSWVYEKDEATAAGLDAAWIDYIQLPAFSHESAGSLKLNTLALPDTICAGEQAQLYVFATGGVDEYTYSWTPSSKLRNSELFNPFVSPQETTAFDVTVTSGLFAANGNVRINVVPLPDTPIIAIANDHLLSSATNGNQWYNSQGIIPGATDREYFASASDTYYAIANIKYCQSPPSNQVVFEFTGIKNSRNAEFTFYPNPFTNNLSIDYTIKSAGNVKIVFYNPTGKEIIIIEEGYKLAGDHKVFLDGSSLAAGLYLCKIVIGDNTWFAKVIKN